MDMVFIVTNESSGSIIGVYEDSARAVLMAKNCAGLRTLSGSIEDDAPIRGFDCAGQFASFKAPNRVEVRVTAHRIY